MFVLRCRITDGIVPQDGAGSAVAVEGGGIDIVQSLAEMCRADDLY